MSSKNLYYEVNLNEETETYEVRVWKTEDTSNPPLVYQPFDPATELGWDSEEAAIAWAESYLESRSPGYILYQEDILEDGTLPEYYQAHLDSLQEINPEDTAIKEDPNANIQQ